MQPLTRSCLFRPRRPGRGHAAGFTLIELVIVMVLLGVLGGMGAEFISLAFKGFRETDHRLERYEEGKLALLRLEREIQAALPNAVSISATSVTGDTISLGMIDQNAMAGVFGMYQESHPSGQDKITDLSAALPGGSLVSIYNTNWAVFNTGVRVYQVVGVIGAEMTLDRNIGPASPYRRYFAAATEAVRFRIDNGILLRETAPVTPGPGNGVGSFTDPYPLAKDVVPADSAPYFTYTPGTSSRNAVVLVNFALSREGESVTFHKEIQIRNAP